MSLKTICFLTLLIVSCAIAIPMDNLKNKFLSKTSAQISTQPMLAQVKSFLKDPQCIPGVDPPATVPNGTDVTTIATTSAPASGCIWLYKHCSVSASVSAGPGGVIQWCGLTVLDLDKLLFAVGSGTGITFNNGNSAYNLSGVRLGNKTSAVLYRWQGSDSGPIVDTGDVRVQTNTAAPAFLCGLTPVWNDRVHYIQLTVEP